MKNIMLILLAQFVTLTIFAQSFSVKGQVTDATDGSPLIGAHVILLSKNQTISLAEVADEEGNFVFEEIQNGTYGIGISYIGYSDFTKAAIINGQNLDLGKIKMAEGLELKEVIVIEKVLTAIQLEDTTQINATAY